MTKKLNHSRYIDAGAKDISDKIWRDEKEKPTAKQKKFFTRLVILCKQNDITLELVKRDTRYGTAQSINTMIERLKEKGIDIKSNKKRFVYGVTVGEDNKGRLYTGTRVLSVEEEEEEGK